MEQPLDPSKSRIFQDLVVYSKLYPELVLRRCNYAVTELAILWQQKKSVLDFYQQAELYIYDLTKYQLILEHEGIIKKIIQQMKSLGVKRVLEFGGGIGEFSLCCAEAGFSMTYHDLPGVIKNYAQWRFQKYGKEREIFLMESYPLYQDWDVVNVMDVLEHLEQPERVIEDLRKHAVFILCNPEDVKYNHFYPQHIGRFDISPFFERVEGYLWRNKEKEKRERVPSE